MTIARKNRGSRLKFVITRKSDWAGNAKLEQFNCHRNMNSELD